MNRQFLVLDLIEDTLTMKILAVAMGKKWLADIRISQKELV